MSEAEEKWAVLIAQALALRGPPVRAMTYIETRSSASTPVKVSGSDGRLYFVKGGHSRRQLVNDHIVGRLGKALGAPTAPVAHVEVSGELVESEQSLGRHFPDGGRFQPGVWHGSLVIDDVSNEREGFANVEALENRARFALLAVLYGWTHGSDHQFVYNNQPPRLVHSFDHGHFFPSGPDWTIASLDASTIAAPDPRILSSCSITKDELLVAAAQLEAIVPEVVIADAVGNVLDHWNVTQEEKLAIAQYLESRRLQILSHIANLQ